MVFGLILLTFWSSSATCPSLAMFAYSTLFCAINALYLLQLVNKHFPVYIPKRQRELYKKMFEPWKINRKVCEK
jgi:hypothetical protein